MRALACGLTAALAFAGMPAAAAPKTIAITAIVEHPALDAVRDGVMRGLSDIGHAEGKDVVFRYETAHGNPATAALIAQRLVDEGVDVIVALSTPSAQAAAAATGDIPVIFAAVTDPLLAGLVTSLQTPGGNVTGVSDMAPIRDHVALIREIMPDVARLGVLYNPREANSVSSLASVMQDAGALGIEVIESRADSSAGVEAAARSLIGRVDAIYVPTDNTVVATFETVVSVANEAGMPLFAADTNNVARGAIAAVGFDYFQVGLETAALVDRVLGGEDPGAIPVVFASASDLQVNKTAAAKVGITLPEAVLMRAAKVIE